MPETTVLVGTIDQLIIALSELPAEIRGMPVRVTLPPYTGAGYIDTMTVDAGTVTLS
jgi:hypothetical protein